MKKVLKKIYDVLGKDITGGPWVLHYMCKACGKERYFENCGTPLWFCLSCNTVIHEPKKAKIIKK